MKQPDASDHYVMGVDAPARDAEFFTGYTTGATAAFAWKVIGLSVMAIALFVLLYNAVHPHLVVPQ